jgi:hypothetical protein
MKKINKEDRLRLELLKNLMDDFLDGKEKFSSVPYKIKSLYSMFDTIQDDEKQYIFELWGEFEQIYAWMLAQERCELTKEEKAEIEELAKQTKAYSELLLKKYPPEPEDLYAWPFEEYK